MLHGSFVVSDEVFAVKQMKTANSSLSFSVGNILMKTVRSCAEKLGFYIEILVTMKRHQNVIVILLMSRK
jgi:hypothetical protein